MAPVWAKSTPRWAKMVPRWAKMAASWAKMAPRWTQMTPRWATIAPTWQPCTNRDFWHPCTNWELWSSERFPLLYAIRRIGGGTNILAPAVDLDNENPSLVALGKNIIYIYGAKAGQDVSKMAPVWAKSAPRWAKMVPRWAKMAASWAKMAPRWTQMTPRWPTIAPTWHPCANGDFCHPCTNGEWWSSERFPLLYAMRRMRGGWRAGRTSWPRL